MSKPIYLPGYIERLEADAQFERMWNTLDWERRDDAPRREYWQNNYDLPYTYGRGAGERTYAAKPWDDFVKSTMERLNAEFGFRLDCCFMNGYADKRDALGWHADDSPEMDPTEPVISLSLGGERDIEIRDNERTYAERFRLGHGSVFIMTPGMQQTHQHRIPKAGYEVGPRISLTYRGMIV
jgi:alkylated DNA repair dioxygenase AlkB